MDVRFTRWFTGMKGSKRCDTCIMGKINVSGKKKYVLVNLFLILLTSVMLLPVFQELLYCYRVMVMLVLLLPLLLRIILPITLASAGNVTVNSN